MRWAGRAVAAAVVAAGAVLVPLAVPPAAAVWDDPIEPVHDLPSTWRGAGSGGVLDPDDAIIRKYEIDLSRDIRAPKLSPLSIAKGVGVLGIAQAIGMGFGVSSELGVSIYAVMNGATVDEARCEMPDWYNGAVGVLSLGAMGSCNLQFLEPNVGVTPGQRLEFGDFWLTYHGLGTAPGPVYCYNGPRNSTGRIYAPSGYGMRQAVTKIDAGGMRTWEGSGCGAGIAFSYREPPIEVYEAATGQVVASMVETSADPERQARCQVDMLDGSVVSSAWVTYTEGTGFPTDALDAACGSATVGIDPGQIAGYGIETEDHTGTRERIIDVDVPAEHDPRTGRESLILYKVLPTGDLLPCLTNPADCSDWFEESFGEDGDPNNYRCEYGEEYVNLDECIVYRHSFKPGSIGTITDPETGETIDWGQQPINSIDPSTGPGTGASPGTVCMAQWGLVANPIEWVLQPIKCALVWAFVPRTSVVESHVTGLGESVGDIGSVQPILTLIDELPSSSGCSGIPITLEFFGEEAHGNLLAACDGEAAAAATVVNGLLTLGLTTGAILALVRYAAAVFGFVGPGGAIEQTQAHVQRSGKGGD